MVEKLDYMQQAAWSFSSGQQQSPVALHVDSSQVIQAADLLEWQVPYYGETLSDQANNMQLAGKGYAKLDHRNYRFVQLHFHAPAEHVIEAQKPVMEWHFVHENTLGQKAVIAVTAVLGKENPQLAQLLAAFIPKTALPLPEAVLLTSLLPTRGLIYRYVGSLTTPPLSEGVEWFVAAEPLTVSPEQLAQYRQLFPQDNNRALQPLNQRPVMGYDLGAGSSLF
ncbi:carbonic anhydrase family protein [Loigolactobacillus zhaoyuanensis]|uniref:carbonic anhydrase n=1 Tax=Loigolactobacillus zhaoyuanensis TaxID=2486017 RepID=A0ABW8UBP5_9LACO|nr:carbonic anhydrase family protein [Loigolactobacillus zhaoyuanensis]